MPKMMDPKSSSGLLRLFLFGRDRTHSSSSGPLMGDGDCCFTKGNETQ